MSSPRAHLPCVVHIALMPPSLVLSVCAWQHTNPTISASRLAHLLMPILVCHPHPHPQRHTHTHTHHVPTPVVSDPSAKHSSLLCCPVLCPSPSQHAFRRHKDLPHPVPYPFAWRMGVSDGHNKEIFSPRNHLPRVHASLFVRSLPAFGSLPLLVMVVPHPLPPSEVMGMDTMPLAHPVQQVSFLMPFPRLNRKSRARNTVECCCCSARPLRFR
jgi:hypothetical protein